MKYRELNGKMSFLQSRPMAENDRFIGYVDEVKNEGKILPRVTRLVSQIDYGKLRMLNFAIIFIQ